jgi:spermidine synthase
VENATVTDRPAALSGATIAALFFLSGASGLVYQILWVRMLLPVFGTGIHAVSTVVASFMAGLALGAFWLGRLADRRGTNGLRIYALLEAGIALWAVLLPLALWRMDEAYTWLYRSLDGIPGGFAVARSALSAALLLPPTTLMGATLPVLVRHVTAHAGLVGRSAGTLYGLNTLGAVAGSALAAFVLIERFGVGGANALAAATNASIAAAAWLASRAWPTPAGRAAPPAPGPTPHPASPGLPAAVLLSTYALSGFAALGFEVVWSRMLSVTLRITTTQSLSVVLIVFLAGLALGSAAGARWIDGWRHLPGAFALLELALGLAGTLSLVALGAVPSIAAALGDWPGWHGHVARLLTCSAAVMLLPTFLMGLAFPLVAQMDAAGRAGVGHAVGRIYAANTLGAIAGALSAGFVLIPVLGSERSLFALAAVNLMIGCGVLLATRGTASRGALAASAVLAGATIAIMLLLPEGLSLRGPSQGPGPELLHRAEGAAGTVTVHRLPDGTRMLRVNGAGEVPSDWASVRTFRLLGTLPLVLHREPDDVLVIAFGGGITLAAVESQRPRRIDCVEIVPGVLQASRQFADLNERVFERVAGPTIHMVYDDGRNHVLRTTRSYDVILSDSTHPNTADSWVLYTEEFYRSARARLKPGGVFAQWLPIHGLTVEDYRMLLRTFRAAFPHATLWHSRGYSILLARPEPLEVDLDEIARRLAPEDVHRLLAAVDLDDAAALLATLALDEAGFAAYAGTGPTNTDDHPWISFHDRTRAGAHGALVVASFAPHFVRGIPPWLEGRDPALRDALERRMGAVRLTLGAELALLRRDRSAAISALRQALEIAPRDETARRQLAALGGGAPAGAD